MNPQAKKKLFFVITKGNWGGAQRYVYDLATHCDHTHFDVTVILGNLTSPGSESGRGLLQKKLLEKGVRTIILDHMHRDIRLADEWRTFLFLLRLFLKERPDIIHLNSSKAGGLAALAGRIAFIPAIIFTIHGWPAREPRAQKEQRLIAFLSWLTVFLTHASIVISKQDFTYIQKLPLIRNKLAFIHNGIEPHAQIERDDARSIVETGIGTERTIDKDGIWVGTIAELHPNKDLLTALRAFATARKEKPYLKLSYVIAGGGSEEKRLKKFAKELDIADDVYFLGFVPNASALLSAFSLFLLTSVKEGLPYVILEAGLAELPVIATNVGETAELIIDNSTGRLLPAGDHAGIAKAIMTIAEDSRLRTAYGENLKKLVLEKFSLSRMVEQTERLYRALE